MKWKGQDLRICSQPAITAVSLIYPRHCYNALSVTIIALEASAEELYLSNQRIWGSVR